MSDIAEIKKGLEDIKQKAAEFDKEREKYQKELEEKGRVSAEQEQKIEKLEKSLADAEDKQAKNLQALEDEINTLKKGSDWQKGDAQERQIKQLEAIEDMIRKGTGMDGNNPLSLKNLTEDQAKYFEKTMISGSSEDGGFLTINPMQDAIIRLEKDRSPIRQIARVISGSSPRIEIPVQRTRFGAKRVGETKGREKTDTAKTAMTIITAEELFAAPEVSQTMIDDAAFPLLEFINSEIADEFVIKEGEESVTGDGVKQFRGFTTLPDGTAYGQIQRVQSTAAALAYEDFVNLDEAIKAVYQTNARWLMNRTVRGRARLITDNDGQPILLNRMANTSDSGLPEIFGKPVMEFPDLPNLANDATPIAFGDFRRGYTVYDRMGIRLLRDPYSLREEGLVVFQITKRSGGAPTDFQAIKLLEMSA